MNKKLLLIMFVMVLLTGCGTTDIDNIQTTEETEVNQKETNIEYETAKVIRVVDGDTVQVDLNGQKEKIRMILVDTPETVHPSKPVEFYGKEASNYTKKILKVGKEIYLTKDVTDRDKYNRILRYIWLEPPISESDEEIINKCYNAILLKEGYAKLYTYPPDIKYVDLFKKLEKEARENSMGLWSKDNQTEKKDGKIIGNKNSKVYHQESCSSVSRMSDNNKIYFNSQDEAEKNGYKPCKNCN